MAEDDNREPYGAKPESDDDAKNSSAYSKEVKPTHYTHVPGKGFKKDEKEGPERKVTIYQHKWGGKDGYLGKSNTGKDEDGKFGSYNADAGLWHYKTEAVSEISYDIDKKELTLTPIAAKADFSVAHAGAEGEFKLGAWIASWFGGEEAKQSSAGTPGVPSLMAARVGDLTGHGSPLAPGIGSPNVYIGYMPAWRTALDFHACPIVKGLVPDVGGMVAAGSPTVFINFVNACRVGDLVVEVPGGPNPIAMGCPSVFIGSAGAGSKVAAAASEGVLAKGKIEGDALTAHAEASAGIVITEDSVEGSIKGGVMVALVKGAIEGGITIPLWGKHSITIKGQAEGSAGSAGLDGHAEAGWSKDEGYHASAGFGAALGLGGSAGFSLGFK